MLELPSDLKYRLRQEAAANGVDADSWAGEILARHLRRTPRWSLLTEEEIERLNALNAEFPETFWQRYRYLQNRLQAGESSSNEREELLAMTDCLEEWNVRRLTFLEEAAQKRGKHFPALMKALRIRHHPLSEW